MKKWNAICIFTVLVIGMVLMSGCADPGSKSTAPMQYFRMAPAPCVRSSHPAGVSIGEPQFPIWMNSHGSVGRSRICDSYQKCRSSEYMIRTFCTNIANAW